jgi:hypothetical protein
MKSALLILAMLLSVAAPAQERLSRAESLKYAFFACLDLKEMLKTPIPTDPDIKRPAAVRDGDYGGLVLPETRLTAQTLAKAEKDVVPIGQLWLVKVAPVVEGQPVPAGKLRMVEVKAESSQASVACCALGVRKDSGGSLQLLVYGKEKEPVLTTSIKSISGQQNPDAPIELSAERESDGGRVTLKLCGKYEASFKVTEAEQ